MPTIDYPTDIGIANYFSHYKLDTTSAIAISASSAKGITMPYLTISLVVKPSFLKSSTISLGKLIFGMVVMFCIPRTV